jgi:hypothetical protein
MKYPEMLVQKTFPHVNFEWLTVAGDVLGPCQREHQPEKGGGESED